MSDRSAGETCFIEEFTRTMLVTWAAQQIQSGSMTIDPVHQVYATFAQSKGWITKDLTRVTSVGFKTAGSRLKGSR